MLIRTHQLDNHQLHELDVLSAHCKEVDSNIIAVYQHLLKKDRTISCSLLEYKKQQLIGFLSIFFFYENICEISIMVDPAYRRRGIATKMLHEIAPVICDENIGILTFSSPHQLNNAWLSEKGFEYQGSEYQMHRHLTEPQQILSKSVTFRMATQSDIPTLCEIDNTCFPKEKVDMPMRFEAILADSTYTVFLAIQNGVPVGKAHLFWQNDHVRLTDIAIIPRVQGHGFGTALISHCLNYCLLANKPHVILEVETSNQNALNLYTRLEFTISNAHDYWNIPANYLDKFYTQT